MNGKLDWNTLQMVTASHGYQLGIKDGNKLTWSFNKIKLVDSVRNEPASHGYIVYRIKTTLALSPLDTVKNAAGIYFDFNLPVQTNTEKTTVQSSVLPVKVLTFVADRNRKSNLIQWSTSQEINIHRFEIQRSVNGRDYKTVGMVSGLVAGRYLFSDDKFEKTRNYYRLKMVEKDGRFEFSPISSVNNTATYNVNIYPNPVKNTLSLEIRREKSVMLQVRIITVDGRALLSRSVYGETGAFIKVLDVSALKPGTYFAELKSPIRESSLIKFQKL